MKHLLLMLVCAGGLAVAGCGSDDEDGGDEEGGGDELVVDPDAEACQADDAPTYDNFGEAFVGQYCLGCHSVQLVGASDRSMAPDGVNFDTLEDIKGRDDDVYHEVVVEKAMPLNTVVADSVRDKFGLWLECGAP